MEIISELVVEHGEVHWKVTNGKETIHCDYTELKETIKELEEKK